MVVAGIERKYHPIKDYFATLKDHWDGIDHIAKLCEHFKRTDGLFTLWFTHWIVGAIARVLEGYQNPMLCIDGPQDVGKSYFARWICPLPQRFYEGAIIPENKDCIVKLTDNLVWEVGELGVSTRKADVDAMKFFLTMQTVKLRKAYDKRDIRKPALASFIGTFNNDGAGFLVDETGNRRFLTCSVQTIDHSYTTIDKNSLWAQALSIYRKGDDAWRLTKEQKKQRDETNEAYTVVNPVADALVEMYHIVPGGEGYTTSDAICYRLHKSRKFPAGRGLAIQVGKALKKMGIESKRIEHNDQRVRVYPGVTATFETQALDGIDEEREALFENG
jgi:putative DNA primase/helicase